MMSDSTKVDATIVEPCDQLEVKHIDVPEVVSNVASVKAWVDGELSKYQAFEIDDEDSYKVAKAQRANVRKLKIIVDSERKRVKKVYERPLKDFEAQVKTITEPVDKLDAEIKDQINQYDKKCQQRQYDQLAEYYSELSGILADSLSFDQLSSILDPGGFWLKRSNFTKAESEISVAVNKIAHALSVIDNMECSKEEKTELKADYLSCLDLVDATQHMQKRRDACERAEQLEEEQRQLRNMQQPADQQQPIDAQQPAQNITYMVILPEQQVGNLSQDNCDEIMEVFKKYGIHGSFRKEE